MISGLEACADGILQFEGYFSYGTRGVPSMAYRNRNPGNLRDAHGEYRTYVDFVSGYSDLVRDLRGKFTGHNAHGLGPDSTLLDLFTVYAPEADHNSPVVYCNFVAHWITMVTGKIVVASTKLKDVWSPQ
jgi:hypothetical protein